MSDTVIAAFIAALFGLIGGVVASMVALKTQKPLSEANAAAAIQKAAVDLIAPYQTQVRELETRVSELSNALTIEREARVKERESFEKQLAERDKIIIDLQSQLHKLQQARGTGWVK